MDGSADGQDADHRLVSLLYCGIWWNQACWRHRRPSSDAGSGAQFGGFDIQNYNVAIPDLTLSAGSYWLNLSNATTNSGDPVAWDQNSGPSQASESSVGTIPSQSFDITGSSGSGTGTTPEPGSIVLLGSGVLGLAGGVRRKLS